RTLAQEGYEPGTAQHASFRIPPLRGEVRRNAEPVAWTGRCSRITATELRPRTRPVRPSSVIDREGRSMNAKPIAETGGVSSFWLRSIRMLFALGKPLPPMTLLACQIPSGPAHLTGCLTQTGKDRLLFWTPLPRDTQMLSADGRRGVTDHV